ncbi:hypothetical protein DUZ99_06320 [Xylanibacillus composti]|uniref:Uncharacterized protein n=1 Tax=Xylanibacillus composti TaxID=1572762 RepID=A0A8J4M3L2_9BACL|nr:hypothetical protein [Xylanibacillus composti]MDT9724606.1 hypothetical protein [Xylanibacillus composti]GIQ70220.1 hypothetical protein XYCOK13_30440 [Xylanibacillus composti]
MNKSEFDIHKELESKPFKRHGFNEKLRRRIEERLDEEQQERGSRRWLPFAIGLCAAVLMIWLVNPPFPDLSPKDAVQTAGSADSSLFDMEEELAASSVPLRSALLIAFRQDNPKQTEGSQPSAMAPSHYRTLLIAPDQERLSVAAEGDTLVVPYGQSFWTFTPPEIERGPVKVPLVLRPVADMHAEDEGRESQLLENLRILYAGNRYVSMELTGTAGNTPGELSSYRVYHYADLVLAEEGAPVSAVSLPELLDLDPSLQDSPWYIQRTDGRWGAVVIGDENTSNASAASTWELPQEVVTHDSLSVSREQIQSRQPDARDALESPTGELAAILTDSSLYLYAIQEGELDAAPLLAVPIREGEAIIMAQWAVDRYVPTWIEKLGEALELVKDNERP